MLLIVHCCFTGIQKQSHTKTNYLIIHRAHFENRDEKVREPERATEHIKFAIVYNCLLVRSHEEFVICDNYGVCGKKFESLLEKTFEDVNFVEKRFRKGKADVNQQKVSQDK